MMAWSGSHVAATYGKAVRWLCRVEGMWGTLLRLWYVPYSRIHVKSQIGIISPSKQGCSCFEGASLDGLTESLARFQ